MKKTTKLLSLILSGVMLGSTAAFTVDAKNSAPKYDIDFVYDANSEIATATISVSGGTYGAGRFGLSYNAEALTLINADGNAYDAAADNIADVVIGFEAEDEYKIVATEETNLTADLIDTESGSILFAWYTNTRIVEGKDLGFVEADDDAKVLATVSFVLADELANAENPADALAAVEDALVDVFEGETDDLKGWDDVYSIRDNELNEYVSDDDDIKVNSVITPNMDDVTLTAKASGRNITVSWKPIANEEDNGIASYDVVITDKDGNEVVATNMVAGAENLNSSKKYSIKFTNDDGLEYNTEYVVKVTPVLDSGKLGVSGIKNVKTERSSSNVTGGGESSSDTGASMTFTVTYFAGEGTIPEGQKFKYEVARNGYVGGSPAVIAPEGKIFAGWSVDGVTLISVEVYKITKDIAFKAIYVDKEDETHRTFILGYPGGEVRADNALTRAEAAAIIARASANFDSTKTYTANFTDVPADHWAANYIAFVYESNIVTGYEDNTYHPSSNITRAEFATIMQRYLGIELNEDANFIDVGKDHWAVAYIGACKDAGLINGYENGEFRPFNEITRAEAVKILNRATDRTPNPTAIGSYIAEKGIPFADLDANMWYFYEIMEAAFPHLVSYYH